MIGRLKRMFESKVSLGEYGFLNVQDPETNAWVSRRVTPDEKTKIEDRHIAIGEVIDTSTKIERAYQPALEIEDAGKSTIAGFSRLYREVLQTRADLHTLASCHINFPEDKDYREAWKNTVLEAAIIRETMQEYHAAAFPKPKEEPKAPEPSGKKSGRHISVVPDLPKPQDPAAR
jgi:hypothetical protein